MLAAVLALHGQPGAAHEYQLGSLKIEHPWSRTTAPGVNVGVGYLVIANSGSKADVLVAITSDVAERVEIHSTSMADGVMKMRRQERVELPSGGTVRLEPGGLHLMLMGLRRPLVAGQTVPLVLRFAAAGEQRVELKVEAPGGESAKAAEEHSRH